MPRRRYRATRQAGRGSNVVTKTPDQQRAADEHQARDAHRDCADRAPDNRLPLQVFGQVARGQRDRVIARQHQIDDDDSEQRGEKLRR